MLTHDTNDGPCACGAWHVASDTQTSPSYPESFKTMTVLELLCAHENKRLVSALPAWILALRPEQTHSLPAPEPLLYQNVEPGQWFRFASKSLSRLRTQDGHVTFSDIPSHHGEHHPAHLFTGECVEIIPPLEVAQHILDRAGVAATVVAHEEVRSHVDVSPAWTSGYGLRVGPGGYMTNASHEDLEHIMRQAAAALHGSVK